MSKKFGKHDAKGKPVHWKISPEHEEKARFISKDDGHIVAERIVSVRPVKDWVIWSLDGQSGRAERASDGVVEIEIDFSLDTFKKWPSAIVWFFEKVAK